ncbi:hypothetical protein BAQ47_08470 [Bacillus tropicus]|nr:hypothetical protein BAQ47_08470 [Bacillus tropicus]
MVIPQLVYIEIYQRFFKFIDHNSEYIGDYFNISTIRQGISTYQQIMTWQSGAYTPQYLDGRGAPIHKAAEWK